MTRIERHPVNHQHPAYDVIIVGGGIYGVMLALESARRGLSPLLLERGDFGGGVSFASNRIIHGGLRYLQSMDLKRFRESVGERRWFLQNLPDLIEPMTCVMPLPGKGLKRASVMRMALAMNDFLSRKRNDGVPDDRQLPKASIADPGAYADALSPIGVTKKRACAVWHDARMVNSQRVMMELSRWAVVSGATLRNYTEVTGLTTESGSVKGVVARDVETGVALAFDAPVVINAAGPACAALAKTMGGKHAALFSPSYAINVLFDRPPIAPHAMALTADREGARTFFLSWEGDRLLAGTYHVACDNNGTPVISPAEMTDRFIAELNETAPGLELSRDKVKRVYGGLLPAESEGSEDTAHHPVILDHGESGCPRGLVSVSGVKYTTARLVAEQTIGRIAWPKTKPASQATGARPEVHASLALSALDRDEISSGEVLAAARAMMQDESVVRLEDLLLRRTPWARDPEIGEALAQAVGPALGFDERAIADAVDAVHAGGRFTLNSPKQSQQDTAGDHADSERSI